MNFEPIGSPEKVPNLFNVTRIVIIHESELVKYTNVIVETDVSSMWRPDVMKEALTDGGPVGSGCMEPLIGLL